MSRFRGALVFVVLATVTAVTGCGSNEQEDLVPDPDLTKEEAVAQSVAYLEKTLVELPPGVAWSIKPDHPKLARFTTEEVLSVCSDLAEHTSRNYPSQLHLRYWLTGVPEGEDAEYFGKVVAVWESWGWESSNEPDPGLWAPYRNREDYGLVLNNAKKGTGSVSVLAGTPCILPENLQDAERVPRVIERP